MAQNFWTAIWAWTVCFVATIVISLATTSTKTDAAAARPGLVADPARGQGRGDNPPSGSAIAPFGALVILLTLVLNIIFW